MKRGNQGFTLIELMTVVAIVAILSAVGTPALMRWLEGNRLRGSAVNLNNDLELSKQQAIRNNSPVAVNFRNDGYLIFLDNGTGAGQRGNMQKDPGESIILARDLAPGVLFSNINFSQNRMGFNERGRLRGVPGSVVLTNSTGSRTITINIIGTVNLQ